MSLAEQLGNVGSEYDRMIKAKLAGNEARRESAMLRFLELIDLTLADSRWSGPARRELARLREQSLDELAQPSENAKSLSRYYRQFATLARAKF